MNEEKNVNTTYTHSFMHDVLLCTTLVVTCTFIHNSKITE